VNLRTITALSIEHAFATAADVNHVVVWRYVGGGQPTAEDLVNEGYPFAVRVRVPRPNGPGHRYVWRRFGIVEPRWDLHELSVAVTKAVGS
jgi:hypothetical protein